MTSQRDRTALVTGASGYVGSNLVPRLLADGWTVRVLTRRRASVEKHAWVDDVDIVEGDAGDADALRTALDGVDIAYYLIHSMAGGSDFAEQDRRLAQTFAAQAEQARVGRIVYLGGLHPDGETLSDHLASRTEVGRIFLDSAVPAAVLQAAVVMGDASISFQMLRYLSERLPVMLAPKWLNNSIQPIAIDDLVHYLTVAADLPDQQNTTYDVGGPEVLTYAEMIHRFAEVTRLRPRQVLTVPVLTPGLASRWIGLVTPLDTDVARPLVDSLVHDVVCRDDPAHRLPAPPAGPTGFDLSVERAMQGTIPDHGLRNLALTAAATTACAVTGAIATDPSSRWYRGLDLPRWQPPTVAFPVVWTSLYADIALTSASTLTELERRGRAREAASYRRALGLNLLLNAGWSIVFWRVRRPRWAAVHAAALTASSVDLARRSGQGNPKRKAALLPYAAWCAFATALSSAIARRNPGDGGRWARVRRSWMR